VNVIGILDDGHLGVQGAREVAEIAEAGGGLSRTVRTRELSGTMQMMTRKTVAHTIRQTVNRQLQELFAKPGIEELPPNERARVVQLMDSLEETVELRIALLVDSSLSMKNKLRAVEEAIADLLVNLRARQGKCELCVFHFPAGADSQAARMLLDWSSDLRAIQKLFADVRCGGTTPTGNAILQALDYMTGSSNPPASAPLSTNDDERGLWSEYVV
jgi:Ca-activated chloride channel family protein